MDGARFDILVKALTSRVESRRGLLRSLAAGALGATLVGTEASGTDARAAARQHRCRRAGDTCKRDGQCCSTICKRNRCRCKQEGASCATEGFAVCCSQVCDFLVGGGTCGSCRGRGCGVDGDCCGGQKCVGNFCGGCRPRGTVCTSHDQCCFSDCGSSGACLSDAGGRCVHDADCRVCYLGGACVDACVNGTCTA